MLESEFWSPKFWFGKFGHKFLVLIFDLQIVAANCLAAEYWPLKFDPKMSAQEKRPLKFGWEESIWPTI